MLLVACGGAAKPAASPSEEEGPSTQSVAPASDSEKGAPPAPASPESAPPSGASNFSSSREAEVRAARSDVQRATRDLDASAGDCAAVCRALSSLERATAHLCQLAADSTDRSACDDAKGKVMRARAQIKASCGTCANGASLDANAPVPSR